MTTWTEEQKCDFILNQIQTPWGRNRIAMMMVGGTIPKIQPWEDLVTPLYLNIEDRYNKISGKLNSILIYILTGIDNRSL